MGRATIISSEGMKHVEELLTVTFKLGDLGIEEGEREEKITYPSIDAWVLESFKDELKSALLTQTKPGDEITVEAYKER